ncbi:PEP-CTERM sorting domain-containing protein [Rugamonas sp. FT82W]|uniref:PEP-CTERM sorting domain-containing protein n=1 Tax=Duganella vulcania TaxID=2692166 RepID=A0A845G5J7_9BURK|nr:FxDxF family PEP-CTERM protein [Duganella vulcania]MYM87988.1 PEP-CTERM sorting domain-containing protein [Duganella vulcania]
MKTIFKIALLSTALVAAVAQAGNPGPGTSSAKDVKLAGDIADKYVLVQGRNINPIQSTLGFDSAFVSASGTAAKSWSLAETVEFNDKTNSLTFIDKAANDGLTFSFTEAASHITGTWTVTNTSATKNTTLDLALSFHAGNNVGSFLFNDQTILAGQKLTGSWAINWLNNAANSNSIPGFSNIGFYTGQRSYFTSPVPEPETYGMMLAGLGLIGVIARRRRVK